jgi:O-antigen/teichoic acid export membrane protein
MTSPGPTDVPRATDRAAARVRRASLSSLTTLIARGAQLGIIVSVVALATPLIGAESVGVWLALKSLTAMLTFADLGVGNALVNVVAESVGAGDTSRAKRGAASAIALASAIAVVLLGLVAITWPWLAWEAIFHTSSQAPSPDMRRAVLIALVLFAVSLPLGVVKRLQTGHQRSYEASSWDAAGGAFAVAGVFALSRAGHASLSLVVFIADGLPIVASAVNAALFLRRDGSRVALDRDQVDRGTMKHLLRTGRWFVLLETAFACAVASDGFVATRVLGPEAAVAIAVPSKLAVVLPTLVVLALTPLWPAYGEAIACGDVAWVRRTLVKSYATALLLTVPSGCGLVAFGGWLIARMTRGSVHASHGLLLGLAAWSVLAAVGHASGTFLNAAKVIRAQALTMAPMAVLAFGLKFALAPRFGVAGIVWATVLAYASVTLLPQSLLVVRRLRELERPS